MMTKLYMITFVAIVAVLAVAASPITTAFAQESQDGSSTQSYSEDKTQGDGKDGKSCPVRTKAK
jgi:hypothetical protein